jgi:hydrogenase maturation protease
MAEAWSERSIAVIGMGNIMFCDEGVGTYLASYLENNYEIPENLEIVDGGLLGFSLMRYYQECDKVIIVGIDSREGHPGTISRYDSDEMMAQGATRQTANEVELTMMLEICSFHEAMGEVECITMIPENIVDVRNGLSAATLARMPQLLEETLEALEEEGVILEPKTPSRSFEEIIDLCANPKAQRMM